MHIVILILLLLTHISSNLYASAIAPVGPGSLPPKLGKFAKARLDDHARRALIKMADNPKDKQAYEDLKKDLDLGSEITPAVMYKFLLKSSENNAKNALLLLTQYGFDVNSVIFNKKEPAFSLLAMLSSSTPIPTDNIIVLLSFGANPNHAYYGGNRNTALHMVSDNETVSRYPDALYIIKTLLDYGANINAQNDSGQTPLMVAVKHDNFYVARALVHFKANPLIVDKKGQNALDIVKHFPALKEFEKELTEYTNNYRKKHTQEIHAGTGMPVPVSGIVTEYLIGQKTQQERALQQSGPVSHAESMSDVD